jgi:hypothetical protein
VYLDRSQIVSLSEILKLYKTDESLRIASKQINIDGKTNSVSFLK